MEIKYDAPNHLSPGVTWKGQAPIFTTHFGPSNPHISMWIDLTFTNHGSKREVISSVELHLKKRYFIFWEKSIVKAIAKVALYDNDRNWALLPLEPLSAPVTICVKAEAPLIYPEMQLSKNMRLVLEFRTVGFHRHIRKFVKKVNYPLASTNAE